MLLIAASDWPSKAWRSRVIVTESGTSRRWVVCGRFLRHDPACGAPENGGPPHRRPESAAVDQAVAERSGRGTGRRGAAAHERGKNNKRGTPQGGVISPLLANLYMNRFLKFWRLKECETTFRAHLVNYADDFVILSRGQPNVTAPHLDSTELTCSASRGRTTTICAVPPCTTCRPPVQRRRTEAGEAMGCVGLRAVHHRV
jgi:hypothetical protein